MRDLVVALRELTAVLRELVEENKRNREIAAQNQLPDPMERLTEVVKLLGGGR